MRRSMFILPLLVAAACGEEAQDILDPIASNALVPTTTAVVIVDGGQYTIGCPNFPCPVTPLVLEHIANGKYFWLPSGTFPKPTIYLFVLKVPVQLDAVPTPTIVTPPTSPPAPELTGPAIVQGYPLGAMAQVVCSNIPYALNAPDQGPWDFVNGEIYLDYVTWNATQNQWVSTGQSSIIPFSSVAWGQMLGGTFRTIAAIGNRDYYATVSATLKRGSFQTTVSHKLLCSRQGPPAVIPPAPSIDGETEYHGTRTSPTSGNLVCSAIGVTLTSPDNGPWSFVSGERFLEFTKFNGQTFVLNGVTRTDPFSAADWQDLLDGTYVIDLQMSAPPYFFTFNVILERGQYQHTVTHRAVCGGPDYYLFTSSQSN